MKRLSPFMAARILRKHRVGFKEPNTSYLILIDQTGNVVWTHAGGFPDGHYKTLSSQVAKLLK